MFQSVNACIAAHSHESICRAAEAYVSSRARDELLGTALAIEPDRVRRIIFTHDPFGREKFVTEMVSNPNAGLLTSDQKERLDAFIGSFLREFMALLADPPPFEMQISFEQYTNLITISVRHAHKCSKTPPAEADGATIK